MKNNALKMTTLCMLTIGVSQFAMAETTRLLCHYLKHNNFQHGVMRI